MQGVGADGSHKPSKRPTDHRKSERRSGCRVRSSRTSAPGCAAIRKAMRLSSSPRPLLKEPHRLSSLWEPSGRASIRTTDAPLYVGLKPRRVACIVVLEEVHHRSPPDLSLKGTGRPNLAGDVQILVVSFRRGPNSHRRQRDLRTSSSSSTALSPEGLDTKAPGGAKGSAAAIAAQPNLDVTPSAAMEAVALSRRCRPMRDARYVCVSMPTFRPVPPWRPADGRP